MESYILVNEKKYIPFNLNLHSNLFTRCENDAIDYFELSNKIFVDHEVMFKAIKNNMNFIDCMEFYYINENNIILIGNFEDLLDYIQIVVKWYTY